MSALALLLAAVPVGLTVSARAQDQEPDFTGTQPAPDFPGGLEWVNVPAPLTWEALRGKVVLLDFWTYGCINCIHIIPDLKRLEAEYPDELVVIGVHSAKFDNEGDTANIRQIVQRYEIEHPVINDKDFIVWRAWGARAWPTVAVVDPEGMVFGGASGEGVYERFKPTIEGMVNQFDAEGKINRDPIELALETEARPESLLAFPGKVLADADGGRLFVSDTNHNRIVVADLATYEVLDVIGGMAAGSADGDFAAARFDKPQGLTLDAAGAVLYVADTENHTLRAVDLAAKTVTTVAGTGEQVYVRTDPNGAPGLQTPLNSPWDVEYVNGIVYIAMAGPHQLWRYDVANDAIYWHSGNLREGIVDGPHSQAQLAQPSGLATDGAALYFADSEASGIRISDIDPAGGVRTIVGVGLFDFGDVDGVGDAVRLQHALGVEYVDSALYVADTYNSKIKRIDPATRESVSVAGDTSGGYHDGSFAEARFDEPGGLSYADGKLYMADTNNHVIRVLDLSAQTVSSVRFPNPAALQAGRDMTVVAPAFTGDEITLEPQVAAPGDGEITLDVQFPEGYKLNDIAPFSAEWHVDGQVVQLAGEDLVQRIVEPAMPLTIPAVFAEGSTEIAVDLNIYYCEAINESLCFVDRVRIHIPVTVGGSGAGAALHVERVVTPPEVEG
ncbi:MAG: redoxin domain-containing protein [Anaerolineae bacterium]|nr:redoxin domain-containing protein [Anaerolineae bacterium]